MTVMRVCNRADATATVKGRFITPPRAAKVAARFPQIQAWQNALSTPGDKDRIAVRPAPTGEIDAGAFQTAFQARLELRPEVLVLPDGGRAQKARRLVDGRSF